ncbi:hypothetical protein DFQ09_10779 [Winogradskyella pacifica]|uniref:Outer membrane beta-barrel porin/alpha-amylase n=1 Tax=Winogradskyella pacifica TaxID=664642 RepID=A0A3D9LNX3_9FLAO|nr:hypothetical protein [Winogradskyella pacifica]REE08400.1 hypothetical protein DFQ09_10779 [Winogradskyella pacifica]
MTIKKLVATLAIILFSFQLSFAQWTKDKGKGYYKVSAWYLESDQHYTDTGDKDPNATRTNFNFNFYGQYGLTKKWDLIAYVPFFARTTQNDVVSGTTGDVLTEGEAVNSIGDIDLGISYGIFNKNSWALSATFTLGLPTGKSEGGSDGSFQTGDGEFNQLVQLNLGKSFNIYNQSFYGKAYFGFNNRTNDFSDQITTGIEFGTQLIKNKFWLIGRLNTIQSLHNGSLNAQNSQGSIFANNIEYVGIGGEASYYITKKLGVSLNYSSLLSGKIIAANPSISAGVFLDIK